MRKLNDVELSREESNRTDAAITEKFTWKISSIIY